MKFVNGKIAHEHIYWDQACLLAQVGLIDPAKLPVKGKEQAARLKELVSPGERRTTTVTKCE